MGYGYSSFPFWRIYCDDHAELLIKQRLRKGPDHVYNQLLRFCRTLNRIADIHEDLPAIAGLKKIPFKRSTHIKEKKTRGKRSALEDPGRRQEVIAAFLSSYYEQHFNNSSQQFTVTLRRHPNETFEVLAVTVPPPDDQQTQEEEASLGKRKPRPDGPEDKQDCSARQ